MEWYEVFICIVLSLVAVVFVFFACIAILEYVGIDFNIVFFGFKLF